MVEKDDGDECGRWVGNEDVDSFPDQIIGGKNSGMEALFEE